MAVLDPMSGSGTTLITARRLGHKAFGFDSDPLAVNIASAWCCHLEEKALADAAASVLAAAEKASAKSDAGLYPPAADDESRKFMDFWFDHSAKRELCALSEEIERIEPAALRAVLWCAFSRMIITKESGVSLAMDVSHSRPHRVYSTAPRSPLVEFPKAVKAVSKRKFDIVIANDGEEAQVKRGDARKLPLADGLIDLVITSPPYLNAIDYLRGHRLALVWMGHQLSDLRTLRSGNIGTERGSEIPDDKTHRTNRVIAELWNFDQLASRERRMICKYIQDMDQAIGEVARVLRPNAEAVYVVGDCNVKGIFIENSQVVRFLAREHGLAWKSTRRREIPANKRYLPPPCSAKSGKQLKTRMGEEVILTFCKRN